MNLIKKIYRLLEENYYKIMYNQSLGIIEKQKKYICILEKELISTKTALTLLTKK